MGTANPYDRMTWDGAHATNVTTFGPWRVYMRCRPSNPKGLLTRAWLRLRWAFKRRAADG